MNKKETIKIGVLGIGGVGGFIGAPLANTYEKNERVKIIFICRGKTRENIRKTGLIFESKGQKYIAHPYLVSENTDEIGKVDILIITTKSYSLKGVLQEYESVIGNETVIIPLQNMVNAKEIICNTIPNKGVIIEGCIYVSSFIKFPGHIKHVGGPGKIFIGGSDLESYVWVKETISNAGINVNFVKNITEELWRKYLFIAPVGAITTAYGINLGELHDNKKLLHILENMMKEVIKLAQKSNVDIDDAFIKPSMDILNKFPPNTKSSLQLDFENNYPNEKEYLIDYIIDKSEKFGLDTKYFSEIKNIIENKGY